MRDHIEYLRIISQIQNRLLRGRHCYVCATVLPVEALSITTHRKYRFKHCKNCKNEIVYMLYCSLILFYLSYASEIWGNTYKSQLHTYFDAITKETNP